MRYRVYVTERSQNNVSRVIPGAVVYRDGNNFKRATDRIYAGLPPVRLAAAGALVGSTWSESIDGIWKCDEYQSRFAVPESNQFFNIGVLQDGLGYDRLAIFGYTRAQGLVIRYLRSLKS